MVEKSFPIRLLSFPPDLPQPTFPYEFHVTVPSGPTDIDDFKEACADLCVKPIVLDLEINNGSVMKDVMTSSTIKGTDRQAFQELQRISDGLTAKKFDVIRRKIETAPWHPEAPSVENKKDMPDGSYFECHFGITLSPSQRKELDAYILELQEIGKLHISRNAFKQFVDTIVVMATYRAYTGTNEDFQEKVRLFGDRLREKFVLDKVITEFALFDTKVSHDAEWIQGNPCVRCEENCPFAIPLPEK